MTDKEWTDWQVHEKEKEERERRRMRPGLEPAEYRAAGKAFVGLLALLLSPLLVAYVVYRVTYRVSLPVLWVAVGVVFDPWKPLARPLAVLVGVAAALAFLSLLVLRVQDPDRLVAFLEAIASRVGLG